MHGAGNDFVVIDARGGDNPLNSETARHLADRRFGVGCDQIMVILNAREQGHRARYEIFNADGSLAGQCGNGARCVGLFLDMHDGPQDSFDVESPAGTVTMKRCPDGEYEIDMGVPSFEPAAIPIARPEMSDEYRVDTPWGELRLGAVSLGNPHSLVAVDDLDATDIPAIGEFLGHCEAFPDGVNAGFAQVVSRGEIRLRVIERGVGETLACGSGACASVAILRNRGEVDEEVTVHLPGGTLVIKWREKGERLSMKGPAKHVFKGTMNE